MSSRHTGIDVQAKRLVDELRNLGNDFRDGICKDYGITLAKGEPLANQIEAPDVNREAKAQYNLYSDMLGTIKPLLHISLPIAFREEVRTALNEIDHYLVTYKNNDNVYVQKAVKAISVFMANRTEIEEFIKPGPFREAPKRF